jgi:hypothetical protein
MSAARTKKEMLREFKAGPETGGVYALKNRTTGKRLLLSTTTIGKAKNQMDFARATGSCMHPVIANDWEILGADGFELEILETLEKKETQSFQEFSQDITELEHLWREKLAEASLYPK